MAEIEYFVDPLDKSHKKFKNYANFELPLFSRELQAEQKPYEMIKAGVALEKKIINNETLAYFICRTYEFLTEIGIAKHLIRFRQHMADEMAHYS
jgi:glycyl-tRNA synthetase